MQANQKLTSVRVWSHTALAIQPDAKLQSILILGVLCASVVKSVPGLGFGVPGVLVGLAAGAQLIEHDGQDDDRSLDNQLPIEGDIHQG